MLNCRFFVLELKRFSNYVKDISEILELIQLISYELASFTVLYPSGRTGLSGYAVTLSDHAERM